MRLLKEMPLALEMQVIHSTAQEFLKVKKYIKLTHHIHCNYPEYALSELYIINLHKCSVNIVDTGTFMFVYRDLCAHHKMHGHMYVQKHMLIQMHKYTVEAPILP